MASELRDKRQFFRFFGVNILGMIADYLLAVLLASFFGTPYVLAVTCGFILGSFVNYCGHNIFSYEHTSRETISALGFGKYLLAVLFSLIVRLIVVAALDYISLLPFWLILLAAIGVSFVVSYVISTLWVFRKPG
ncbi:GtrA family protein [Ruegeria meonggei]|uniref:GtrA-like protein n=1 Tax=Ruegeria meonggei TaxID=1446476 RepID=A0A1X7ACL3_9RHOB|nr:GtrA family protein [Ruegeria meonggei]SLN75886.1 GtrA-like protein [Ruegeria meonggei]